MLLKSRYYCRPAFVALSNGKIVLCDSRGITSSDYSLFPFRHVDKSVYPLNCWDELKKGVLN